MSQARRNASLAASKSTGADRDASDRIEPDRARTRLGTPTAPLGEHLRGALLPAGRRRGRRALRRLEKLGRDGLAGRVVPEAARPERASSPPMSQTMASVIARASPASGRRSNAPNSDARGARRTSRKRKTTAAAATARLSTWNCRTRASSVRGGPDAR